MQRHGDGSHVYSLPSYRLRLQRASSDNPLGSIHSVAQPQSLHHRDGQGSDAAAAAAAAARKPRYTPEYWHLLSLKRSLSGNRSEPSSPTSPNPPTLAQDASRRPTSHASKAPSTLVATLLHVPTGVIYAWPIALSGASNGKCMVTQPHDTLPGAEAFDPDRVMSESIKVLADVIKAWIKTSAMREALRRKESKREKGARKLGEDERDAIWLNESLGLAIVDEGTHASALERSWKEEGELTSPPSQSPSQSPRISASHTRNQPSTSSSHPGPSSRNAFVSGTTTPDSTNSKPATPRIEISAPDYFDGLSQALAPMEPANVDRNAAVEAEITEWMTSASLSDFTRPRSLAGTGKTGTTSEQGPSPPSPASPDPFTSSSAPTSRVGSPVGSRSAGNRKTVTFSDPPSSHSSPTAGPTTLASPSALRSSAYLPAFAPSIQLPPALDDHYFEQGETRITEGSPTMPTYNAASSSSPTTMNAPPSPPSPAPLVPILSNSSPRSAPAASAPSPPLLSPTQSPRQSHSRSRASSKLSQEIPRQELMGLKEDVERSSKRSSRGPGSISPVQSFADIRNAFRAIKPVSKRSKEKAAV